MNQTVVGIFDDPSDAQDAVQQLLVHGFSRADIDISIQESVENEDKISNFFTSLFGSDEGRSYTAAARQCGAIVTVHTGSEDEAMQAAEILDDAGALDLDEQVGQYQAGVTGQQRPMAGSTTGEKAIPIVEEQLNVGKREVETGRVRLRSKIIERPVEEHLRLREEHVHVERHAVNRPATEADMAGFKEGEIEIVERSEVPVVSKEARVVEEVQVGKEVEEREEIVREKLKKTQVDVEGGRRPR
ncbi:YsnF/AvaK domain-containing protein [Methylobacter sp. YRD-M1]|uniref:YsnF/AvaK domain-containing protein n=1 Tax=Methylobacter sp. YRD-M1 TaxID=2911520 RepID=UPI00227D2E74|nr:YsnF/AvaK domain-containing protein [Methylobacter sp. YRD-M1]WAK02341.1 YsnF/AvaK domain-containing protein [Methylobacter sp. YRD-M1]